MPLPGSRSVSEAPARGATQGVSLAEQETPSHYQLCAHRGKQRATQVMHHSHLRWKKGTSRGGDGDERTGTSGRALLHPSALNDDASTEADMCNKR